MRNKIAQYRACGGAAHGTHNPEGTQIYLVPPKFRLLCATAYIVIPNGYYLLSDFIQEVNRFEGKSINEAAEDAIAGQ